MARQALVVDASVGVKWFSDRDEQSLAQALSIRDGHVTADLHIVVPDLFFYEVANALAHKSHIPIKALESVIEDMFNLELEAAPVDAEFLRACAGLSKQLQVTVYDACYAVLAQKRACPLVTANPRHQGRALGCDVIPLEEWPRGMAGTNA